MDTWQAAVLVVVSLVAGATLPILVQLAAFIRSAQKALERTGARADRALDAVAATAERIDRATAGLDEERVRALMDSVDSLARTVNHIRDSARVASAVGAAVAPAVVAGVKAWRTARVEEGEDAQHRDGAAGVERKGGHDE